MKMITTETRARVIDWWDNSVQDRQQYSEMSPQNKYNCDNMLAGFLQACEKFDLMTHDEAQELFSELVGIKF